MLRFNVLKLKDQYKSQNLRKKILLNLLPCFRHSDRDTDIEITVVVLITIQCSFLIDLAEDYFPLS